MARRTGYRYSNGREKVINEQTDNYTLVPNDNDRIVVMNKATAVTVTVPNTLTDGFHCTVIQKGAGQVTFAESSISIENVSGHTKTSGQWAEVSLKCIGTSGTQGRVPDVFILSGSTAA